MRKDKNLVSAFVVPEFEQLPQNAPLAAKLWVSIVDNAVSVAVKILTVAWQSDLQILKILCLLIRWICSLRNEEQKVVGYLPRGFFGRETPHLPLCAVFQGSMASPASFLAT